MASVAYIQSLLSEEPTDGTVARLKTHLVRHKFPDVVNVDNVHNVDNVENACFWTTAQRLL